MATTKRIRRIYTERDRAKTAVILQVNEGNVKRTARETGIPRATVVNWHKTWEREGYPEPVEALVDEEIGDFLETASAVRWEMIEALKERVDRRELTGRDLITGIGVLTDKINILSGLATSRTERVDVSTPDSNDLAKKLLEYVTETSKRSKERKEEISESDEQADKALIINKE
jgi:transposase-like protein